MLVEPDLRDREQRTEIRDRGDLDAVDRAELSTAAPRGAKFPP